MTPDAAPAGEIEVGTGIVFFEPIPADTTLDLVPGPQGGGRFEGHHIWTAIRLTGVAFDELDTYTVRIDDAAGAAAVETVRSVVTAPFEMDEDGRWVLAGIAPRLADCCQVAQGAITMRATVRYLDGGELTASVPARAGACSVTCP